VAVSFTDEKLRIIDFRTGPSQTQDIGNATMQLEGEHSDIIKRIVLSPDGTLLISAGQDGLVKIWDLGMRRCI
jgi:WD40 repeat protein